MSDRFVTARDIPATLGVIIIDITGQCPSRASSQMEMTSCLFIAGRQKGNSRGCSQGESERWRANETDADDQI